MTLREQTEQRERGQLSSRACLRSRPKGPGAAGWNPAGVRTCYQVDTDRIVYSKAFRRLKHKTQVFLQPEGGPLPYPDDPHTGGQPHCPDHRPGAGAERGPDRGYRPGPRFGPHPLRPRGRAAAQPIVPGGFRPLPAVPAGGGAAGEGGEGLNLTWDEVRRGILCHTRARPGRDVGGKSSVWPTRSPTSTTTSRMPCGAE